MNRLRMLPPIVCLVLAGCATVPGNGDGAGTAEGQVSRLATLLAGEYTNHAQVWAARRTGTEVPTEYHVTVVPVTVANAPGPVLRLRRYRAGERGAPVRDVRLALAPGADGRVVQNVQRRREGAWETLAGCQVYWEALDQGFTGETRGDGCRFGRRSGGGEVVIHREWTATPERLRLVERHESAGDGRKETVELAPVRWFQGWAGVRGRDRDGSGEGEWQVERRLRVHDGGGTSSLPDAGDRAHALRLERLTWPNSGIRMLRLSVVDPASGEVIAYAWAPTDADRIGIHLGWLQAGLRAKGGAAPGPSAAHPAGRSR